MKGTPRVMFQKWSEEAAVEEKGMSVSDGNSW